MITVTHQQGDTFGDSPDKVKECAPAEAAQRMLNWLKASDNVMTLEPTRLVLHTQWTAGGATLTFTGLAPEMFPLVQVAAAYLAVTGPAQPDGVFMTHVTAKSMVNDYVEPAGGSHYKLISVAEKLLGEFHTKLALLVALGIEPTETTMQESIESLAERAFARQMPDEDDVFAPLLDNFI